MDEYKKLMLSKMDALKKKAVSTQLTATVRPMKVSLVSNSEDDSPSKFSGPKTLEKVLSIIPVNSIDAYNELEFYLEDNNLQKELVNRFWLTINSIFFFC